MPAVVKPAMSFNSSTVLPLYSLPVSAFAASETSVAFARSTLNIF